MPAFSYRDARCGRVFRLFEVEDAKEIERRIEGKGEPLLAGGSAYCDIYTGGAQEAHFCMSTLGLSDLMRKTNPTGLFIMLLFNLHALFRIAALLVIEMGLAVVDFFRGIISGFDLWKELKFVPTRVGICILLRKLVTIGARMDVARGLPVIHLNLLGYDEQAHRRGPSSRFAHWVLKGIDGAIRKIWRAAQRSAYRDYDLWVYADHGQEETLPYPKENGLTVQAAVANVFDEAGPVGVDQQADLRSIQSQRICLLGSSLLNWLVPFSNAGPAKQEDASPIVAAMGPVGHVYPQWPLDRDQRSRLARALAESAHVPLVLSAEGPDEARAWTGEGEFALPAQAGDVFGADHPFLAEVTRDTIDLCHHPDSGEFVISGWRLQGKPDTFPIENGSHAGPGPDETGAFALLPVDTPLPQPDKKYLRPLDLREAALTLMGRRQPQHIEAEAGRSPTATETIRVLTYNVHSCIGMDGKLSTRRIARVISQCEPDIVCLQELDMGRARTGGDDQAHLIAQSLKMDHHFHPVLRIEEELYGDAVMSRFPMRLARIGTLPGLPNWPRLEPRGALWVTIEADAGPLQIMNTHLGLVPREQLAQACALLAEDWLGHPDCRGPVTVCGDFNALPGSPVCRRMRQRLRDAQIEKDNHQPAKTWFGCYPLGRIDHIFVSSQFEVVKVEVVDTDLARIASDHRLLIAELRIQAQSEGPSASLGAIWSGILSRRLGGRIGPPPSPSASPARISGVG